MDVVDLQACPLPCNHMQHASVYRALACPGTGMSMHIKASQPCLEASHSMNDLSLGQDLDQLTSFISLQDSQLSYGHLNFQVLNMQALSKGEGHQQS